MHDNPHTLDLDNVWGTISQRWVVVTAAVALGLVVATSVWLIRPTSFQTTAIVTVAPITIEHFDPVPDEDQVSMGSEVQSVTSGPVLERALKTLAEDGLTSSALRSALQVDSPTSSMILMITASGSQPAQAQARANAVADAYLAQRSEIAEEDAKTLTAALDEQIKAATERLEKASKAKDQAELAARYRADLAELQQRREEVSQLTLLPGRVTSPAKAPGSPSSFGLPVYLAAGLFLGLILGVAAALVQDRVDDKVGTPTRLSHALGGTETLSDAGADLDKFLRETLFQIDLIAPAEDGQSRIVSIIDPADGALTRALAKAGSAQGDHVATITAETHPVTDLGSVQLDDGKSGLILLQLTDGPDSARSAALAARSDLILVASTADQPITPLRTLSARLAAQGRAVGAALMLSDSLRGKLSAEPGPAPSKQPPVRKLRPAKPNARIGRTPATTVVAKPTTPRLTTSVKPANSGRPAIPGRPGRPAAEPGEDASCSTNGEQPVETGEAEDSASTVTQTLTSTKQHTTANPTEPRPPIDRRPHGQGRRPGPTKRANKR